ncbi:ABC transporter substrate-binding protein [Streptomyces macrosporus]|uniref:Extracellular solute-binding protein n=1 Tax=Streptomyces macrosporus TaxID=44032 RepID=A0ABP5WL80_9ACTN
MRRRRFLGLASGVAGSLAWTVTGCGKGETAGTGNVTLTVVATDYGDLEGNDLTQTYWDDLVAGFEQGNPGVKVKVSVHAPGKAEEKVADLVAKGTPPDLAQLSDRAHHAPDLLYRADELLSIPVQADFVPELAAAGEVRRVQYALPFAADLQLLYYNRDLFAAAGLDPDKPPRTWEELKRAALALKGAGVNIPCGLPLGPEEAHVEAMTWLVANGGRYTGDEGLYALDSPENIETMEWLRKELVGRGLTTANPATTERQALFDLFTRGQVGMLNGGLSLMRQAERKKLDYGMAPLPGNGGLAETTAGATHWMVAFRREGNQEAIKAFLGYVYAVKSHYAFADRYHMLPVTLSGTDRMRTDKRHERMWPFLDRLGAAVFQPAHKASWVTVRREIGEHIGQAVLADGDPAGVLGTLQRAAEEEEAAREE